MHRPAEIDSSSLSSIPLRVSLISKVFRRSNRSRAEHIVTCFIIAVIAGSAPRDVVVAIRALVNFRYRVQAYGITDDDITFIISTLNEFHSHKRAILDVGLRQGKGGKQHLKDLPPEDDRCTRRKATEALRRSLSQPTPQVVLRPEPNVTRKRQRVSLFKNSLEIHIP
ncbi:hypothetical protein J3R83DRAFT_11383 [Lanmaoa asiatica]|nr:hypothetical protein J3R83DRAFT_11383 [Lanmaoa asiatica]